MLRPEKWLLTTEVQTYCPPSSHPWHRVGPGDSYFGCHHLGWDSLWGTHGQNMLQSPKIHIWLRVLVAHGHHGQRLFDVVRATTLARLLYASSVWLGLPP